jgi:predicted nucleic acid-binding protein
MPFLIDTNVAIRLRDGDEDMVRRVGELEGAVMLSIVTRVELEGGVHRVPAEAGVRRARQEALLAALPVVAFDDAAADAYSAIVAAAGYSRRKLLDRMIAAQALVHRATLVTLNPGDFADVPDLDVMSWEN